MSFLATSAAIKELEEINRHFQEHDEYDKPGDTETIKKKSYVENQQINIAASNEVVEQGECVTLGQELKNCDLDTQNSPDDNSDNIVLPREDGD